MKNFKSDFYDLLTTKEKIELVFLLLSITAAILFLFSLILL
jgi:hypothetical protein